MELLSSSYMKYSWKKIVRNSVDAYWVSRITGEAERHKSLQLLNIQAFTWGYTIHARLMVATGTYVLQTNRAAYNQNNCDARCSLCGEYDETLSHFLLECSALEETRHPIIQDVLNCQQPYPALSVAHERHVVGPSWSTTSYVNNSRPIA